MAADRKLVNPARMMGHLGSFVYVARCIEDGLQGDPFEWGEAERLAYTEKARAKGK